MKLGMREFLAVAAIMTGPALAAAPAQAAETLIYTGSVFTQSNTNPLSGPQPVDPALGTSIIASFTIPVAVGFTGEVTTATDWSISTVGGPTITLSNGSYQLDLNLVNGLPADGPGIVADWSFTGFGPNNELILSIGPPDGGAHDLSGPSGSGLYNLTFTSGTWALAAVPEPATWAMMLIGLGGVGGVLRAGRRAKPVIA